MTRLSRNIRVSETDGQNYYSNISHNFVSERFGNFWLRHLVINSTVIFIRHYYYDCASSVAVCSYPG